jgi:hypothetical protein
MKIPAGRPIAQVPEPAQDHVAADDRHATRLEFRSCQSRLKSPSIPRGATMNNAESVTQDGEIPIYDAVKYLTKDEIEQTVRKNAAARHFGLTDEHMNVIHSLIEHYKQDC